MGCDIHAYAEYRKKGQSQWNGFGGRINPGRDYDLFGKLADVRGGPALIEPRGIPSDLAWEACGDYHMLISDEHEGDGWCSTAKAQEWVAAGLSKIVERNGRPDKVTDPDAHSASWLTADEFEAALNAPARWPHGDEYFALLAAMRDLEKRQNDVRLVFWFDN